ncbi:MAG: hypothetical protein NVSMB39_7300 [Candidatus Saccharimonadales bacterium]
MSELINPKTGMWVTKLTGDPPPFETTEWAELPIGSTFVVMGVNQITVLGGKVVRLEPVPRSGIDYYIPLNWFNTNHFQVVS